jgi:hypothetical protein
MRISLALGSFILALVLASAQQAHAQVEKNPTLLGMINERLAGTPGLGKVNLLKATYSKGAVLVEGTVATAEQRDQVKAAIEKLLPQIRSTLDLNAKTVDVSNITISSPGQPSPDSPLPVLGTGAPCCDAIVIVRHGHRRLRFWR